MTIRNPHRFESLPVWSTNKGDNPPTRDELIKLARKRKAVRRRDKERDKMIYQRERERLEGLIREVVQDVCATEVQG